MAFSNFDVLIEKNVYLGVNYKYNKEQIIENSNLRENLVEKRKNV